MKKQHNPSNFNQALWLFISQAGTFILIMASAAILSRYFDKPEYGTYKQVMWVYTTLYAVFAAGLPGVFSYFIPRLNHRQGKTLVNKLTYLLFFLGAAFSLTLYFGSSIIAHVLNNPELDTGLRYFALVPVFTLPTMGVEGIYVALRKTKYLAFYHIISRLFNLICVVTPVLLVGANYKIALIGWTLAAFLIFLMALWMKNRPYIKIQPEHITNMYKMVFNYSIPLMGAGIVGILLQFANQFFISRYYGTVVFAEFSNGFISLPFVGMVAGSVKGVLTPLFSRANYEGNIQDILSTYKNAALRVVNILFPILVFCLFFAKDIMVFLYGSQYEVSKSYFQIAIIRDFWEILPYLAILLAFGKTKVNFYMNLVAATVVWIADAVIVYYHLPPVYIAVASSTSCVLMLSAIYLYINNILRIKLIKPIIKHLLIVTLHSSLILFAVHFFSNTVFHDLKCYECLIVSGIVFYILLIATGLIIKINYSESFFYLFKKDNKH